MFKILKERVSLIVILASLSMIMYSIHYSLFGNIKDTASNIVLSLAFVPIGIFYNILVIDRILDAREKIKVGNKINIIMGAFFSEMGTLLINEVVKADTTIDEIREYARITKEWDEENFKLLKGTIDDYKCKVDIDKINFKNIELILDKKDDFLLNLISNPILDEYNDFTDMLISIYHVKDEFNTRFMYGDLKDYERVHILRDICRAYLKLLSQWVDYMEHLNIYYPSLFIKALIASPFDNRSLKEKDKEYLELKDEELE